MWIENREKIVDMNREKKKPIKMYQKKKKKRIERSKENNEKIHRHVRICLEDSKALEMVIIKGC